MKRKKVHRRSRSADRRGATGRSPSQSLPGARTKTPFADVAYVHTRGLKRQWFISYTIERIGSRCRCFWLPSAVFSRLVAIVFRSCIVRPVVTPRCCARGLEIIGVPNIFTPLRHGRIPLERVRGARVCPIHNVFRLGGAFRRAGLVFIDKFEIRHRCSWGRRHPRGSGRKCLTVKEKYRRVSTMEKERKTGSIRG